MIWTKFCNVMLQDSRSVGAIAGLAFALVFTWRLLRAPSEPQRRQSKRQAPSASSSGVRSAETVNVSSAGAVNPAEDSRTQNAIDEFFQPVKVGFFFTVLSCW